MVIPKIIYFLAYAYSFVLYGSIITGLGPIIPYFASATGKKQTYFSYVFFVRAAGYLFGGSLVKYLTQYFSTHAILMSIELIGGLALIGSSLSLSFYNLGFCMFISATCCCMINVISNMCILKLYANQDQDYWIQMLHLIYGAGGLIGPFIIIHFQEHSFFFIGLLFISTMPTFYFLKSPQNMESLKKNQMIAPISKKVQIMICVLYLFYIGQQVGFGSWIPTYAVLEKIASRKGASILGSMFWISNTFFRVLLLFLKGKISQRLKILLIGMIAISLFLLALIFMDQKEFAAYSGVILIGMFLASMFALFITLPGQFGFKVTSTNTANFMMCASMGEGALTMPIGYAMGIFGPTSLFVLILLFSVVMYLVFNSLMYNLIQDSKNKSPITQKLIDDDQSRNSENMLPY